jgi:hypothetical protein
LIAEGGKFIVDDTLALLFSNLVYSSLLCDCSSNEYLVADLKVHGAPYTHLSGERLKKAQHPYQWKIRGSGLYNCTMKILKKSKLAI